MLVEAVRESISAAEQRKAAVEAELETLREIEGLAEKLNGADALPEPAAAPMRPRQHDATRAEQRAGKKTSARPAPATSAASGASQRQAPASGGRYDAAEVLKKARDIFAKAAEPISVAEVTRRAGFADKNDRALTAVRQAVLDLLGEKFIVHTGNGRGGHPRYFRARSAERAVPLPAGPSSEVSNVVDRLVDRIVEQLEIDGGRVSRVDLRERVGDPDFEDFNLALDRAVNLKKIAKTSAGGVAGYEVSR